MAKTVYQGGASIDERGKATGGQAGNQKEELRIRAWYKHSKGWVVLRAKNPAVALKIAAAMRAAVANKNIGYDQAQRDTLYNAVKGLGFDPAKASKPVETDCSALVRVCVMYAFKALGIGYNVPNFRTTNQASVLMASGEFEKLTASKYVSQADYLKEGDILVTKTQGHTVVVLNDGDKAESNHALGSRELRKGMSGADVADMQARLIAAGYDLGKWGADGDFGAATEAAVQAFQRAVGLSVDGVYGKATHAALTATKPAVEDEPDEPTEPTGSVVIQGGNAYIRSGPGTQYDKVGIARAGERYELAEAIGWVPVLVDGEVRYVSAKFAKVQEG
jgi:peptidoglycan hydrolase-like protein with peptidoglycan-binding domain